MTAEIATTTTTTTKDFSKENKTNDESERPSSLFPLPPSPLRYLNAVPPFPTTYPKQYPLDTSNPQTINVQFDPKIHLAQPLEVPKHIKILVKDTATEEEGRVKLVQVPTLDLKRKTNVEDLAYTEPFRILSEEGVKVFKRIIEASEETMAICTPRNPKIIRGLGFTSQFVKDFNESKEVLNHLGTFANVPIAAHPMTTNYSQINYGEPPNEDEEDAKPADVWHLDSVDYVLVVMLTDGFEGGELLVSNMDPNIAMERIRANDLPDDLTSKIKYTAPGYGVFMQGCRIAHAVGAVTKGSTRLTAVSSYASCDALRIDRPSIYNALSQNHTKEVYDPDYLRNMAWRVRGKLDYLISNPTYDNPKDGEKVLDLAIEQLIMARRLMKGEDKYDAPLSKEITLEQGGFQNIENQEENKKEES